MVPCSSAETRGQHGERFGLPSFFEKWLSSDAFPLHLPNTAWFSYSESCIGCHPQTQKASPEELLLVAYIVKKGRGPGGIVFTSGHLESPNLILTENMDMQTWQSAGHGDMQAGTHGESQIDRNKEKWRILPVARPGGQLPLATASA